MILQVTATQNERAPLARFIEKSKKKLDLTVPRITGTPNTLASENGRKREKKLTGFARRYIHVYRRFVSQINII